MMTTENSMILASRDSELKDRARAAQDSFGCLAWCKYQSHAMEIAAKYTANGIGTSVTSAGGMYVVELVG